MERICLEVAAGAEMPEDEGGARVHGRRLPAAILDVEARNAFVDTVQTQGSFNLFGICCKLLILLGSNPGPRD